MKTNFASDILKIIAVFLIIAVIAYLTGIWNPVINLVPAHPGGIPLDGIRMIAKWF